MINRTNEDCQNNNYNSQMKHLTYCCYFAVRLLSGASLSHPPWLQYGVPSSPRGWSWGVHWAAATSVPQIRLTNRPADKTKKTVKHNEVTAQNTWMGHVSQTEHTDFMTVTIRDVWAREGAFCMAKTLNRCRQIILRSTILTSEQRVCSRTSANLLCRLSWLQMAEEREGLILDTNTGSLHKARLTDRK